MTPAPPAYDPTIRDRVEVTDEDVEQALAEVPGLADPQQVRMALSTLALHGGYALTARPSVVWGGRVTGIGKGGASVVVAVAPMIGGQWIGFVDTAPDQPDPDRPGLGGASFTTAADPLHPSRLLAIPLEPEPHTALLVIPPHERVVSVRAIDRGRNTRRGDGHPGRSLVTIPSDADMGSLRVEAIDSSGGIIAATQWVERGMRTAGQADWD